MRHKDWWKIQKVPLLLFPTWAPKAKTAAHCTAGFVFILGGFKERNLNHLLEPCENLSPSEPDMSWGKWKNWSFWNLDCFLISELLMIPSCILLLNDVVCLCVCVAGVCAVCKYSWLQQGLTRLSLLQTSQLWLPELVLHARYHLSFLSLCSSVFFFLAFSSFSLSHTCIHALLACISVPLQNCLQVSSSAHCG